MYTRGIPVTVKNPSNSKARCCFNVFSRSVMSDSITTPWTVPSQAPLSWDFPGKNTGVGCFSFSRGSSWPRGRTLASFIVGRFFTAEPPGSPKVRCRVYSAPRRRRRTSLMAQMVNVSAYNAEDPGSIPGSGRSPGQRNGNPLQYSHLENPMDREAW